MRPGLIASLLLLAACDKILGLQEHPVPDTGAACTEVLPPNGDRDLDGTINTDDPCPFVAQDKSDEDGDGIPNACDPCGELAGPAAGDDPDCDGVGAACDPDPALQNERQFFGLDTGAGWAIGEATFVGGQAHMTITNTNTTVRLRSDKMVEAAGVYETTGAIDNAALAGYWSVTITLRGPTEFYDLQLEKSTSGKLSIAIQHNDADDLTTPAALGDATAAVAFRLKAIVDAGGKMTGSVRIMGTGATTTVEAQLALDPLNTFGVEAYRDPDLAGATSEVTFDYFARTIVKPQ